MLIVQFGIIIWKMIAVVSNQPVAYEQSSSRAISFANANC